MRTFNLTIKERGSEVPLHPSYTGDVDVPFIVKFFGLHNPDVESYRIEEARTLSPAFYRAVNDDIMLVARHADEFFPEQTIRLYIDDLEVEASVVFALMPTTSECVLKELKKVSVRSRDGAEVSGFSIADFWLAKRSEENKAYSKQ